MSRQIMVVSAVVGLVCGLAACGANSSGGLVARVGATSITKATLDHWTSVMAVTDAASATRERVLQQRALSFLISADWQIGEAVEQGLAVSHGEVERRLNERISSYKNGDAEFHEVLKASGGKTVADVMFEIEAELASARLSLLSTKSGEATVTPAQIASYYRKHRQSFATPEQRQVEIIHTKSAAAARKIERQGGAGRKLASVAQPESLVYVKGLKGGTDTALAKSIFTARRGGFVGPVQVGVNYFVFELTLVTPSVQQTLVQARPVIETKVRAEQRRRAVAEVVRSWRRKWTLETDCRPAFVIPKCKQYIVPKTSPQEAPLVFN